MPSIDIGFLNNLHDDYTKYTCLIETGTADGDSIFSMEPHFDKLYTIEVSEMYYNKTKNKYNGNKIDFILGDSSVVFETLLPTIQTNTVFFLDGHWSGGNTGRSTKDVPLIEEITCIHELFQHEAILIIDDFRLFGLDKSSGKLGEDWSQINKDGLLSILKSRVTDVYHLDSKEATDDRLIIHIKAKE
jgi:hypothetical protein